MAMSVTSNAQTLHKTFSGVLSVTPKSLTYDNKVCVVSVSDDGEVSVYDDDLELIRSFTLHLEKYSTNHEIQERKTEVKAEFYVKENVLVWETGEVWTGTWSQAKEWAAADVPNRVSVEEKIHYQFWPTMESEYWEMEKYGKQHPCYYYQWNAEDGTISVVEVSYREAYTGAWETIDEEWYGDYRCIEGVHMYDYDNDSCPDEPIVFTQTLFNTDEKFEYIESIYEAVEETQYEYDRDNDGEPDHREIYHGWKSVGFRIMSEDGTVLQTISCDDASSKDYCIYKLNDKLYLVMYNYDAEETVFYKIDQQTTSVNRVKAMPALAKLIYSLDGRQQPTMQRGVNVVRDGDGTVKKVMKK